MGFLRGNGTLSRRSLLKTAGALGALTASAAKPGEVAAGRAWPGRDDAAASVRYSADDEGPAAPERR